MSKKRLFQVLDEMNVNDEVNKSETCACCFDMVGANKVKAGGHVTMGVPTEAVLKIFLGEYQPILILLDKKEYHRLKDRVVAETEHDLIKAKNLLNEVFQKHESGLLPDRFVYEKIKEFLYPENK